MKKEREREEKNEKLACQAVYSPESLKKITDALQAFDRAITRMCIVALLLLSLFLSLASSSFAGRPEISYDRR